MNGRQAVCDRVEEFRHQYLGDQAHILPVDVFTLVEIDLKLDVIPFDDLFAKYSVDAALMQDFSGIYVDAESYIVWEDGPLWKQYRLRFSVAHELGHYALHRELAEAQKFKTFDQFFQWIRNSGGGKYTLEQSANEFAGRLLVPRNRLEQHLLQMVAKIESVMPDWRSSVEFLRTFASLINSVYGVNAKVIEVRLEREGLWVIS
jgi:Zn-dependent peptidase ImmA (M78 family)